MVLFIGLLVSTTGQATDDQSIWVSNTFQTDFGGSSYLAFMEGYQLQYVNNFGREDLYNHV